MFQIYPIKVTQESENLFVAECSDLEGAWAEGETAEEAVENCKDAIKGVLQYYREHNLPQARMKTTKRKSFTLEYPMSHA